MKPYINTAGEPAQVGDLTQGGTVNANGSLTDIKKEPSILSSESVIPEIKRNQMKLSNAFVQRQNNSDRIAKLTPPTPVKENNNQSNQQLTPDEITSLGGNLKDFTYNEGTKSFIPNNPDMVNQVNDNRQFQTNAQNTFLSLQRIQSTPEIAPLIESISNLLKERMNLLS